MPFDCTCKICGRVYTWVRRNVGYTKSRCNSCIVNLRRFKIKKDAVAYKGGKCVRCGYDKCLSSLTFHHLDPSQKDFEISGAHCRAWEVILKELDKCILVCRNCHGEIEEEQKAMGLVLDGFEGVPFGPYQKGK